MLQLGLLKIKIQFGQDGSHMAITIIQYRFEWGRGPGASYSTYSTILYH